MSKDTESKDTESKDTESKDTESKDTENRDEPLLSKIVCPVYPYMYHGTYVSYYALIHSECTQMVAFDGPDQQPADCVNNLRCTPVLYTRADLPPGDHHTDPHLEQHGIARPDHEDIDGSIATEIKTAVRHIKFRKRGSGGGVGQIVRAKVWFFKVEPPGKTPLYAGIGYQVDDGDVDRTYEKGEVVVADVSQGRQKAASVLVLTDRDQQIWRLYNILLLKN